MAARKNHEALLRKLKKQVRLMERQREQARKQVKATLQKMRNVARSYKSKLANKLRMMKSKLAAAKSSSYAKAAANFERQLHKAIETKAKAVSAAVVKIEKKHMAKLTKRLGKKGVKTRKPTPTRRSVKRK